MTRRKKENIMARKNSVVEDIQFDIIEAGEMTEEDVNAVADFIARLAYRNLKRQFEPEKGKMNDPKQP
jgi:hypothetical protein